MQITVSNKDVSVPGSKQVISHSTIPDNQPNYNASASNLGKNINNDQLSALSDRYAKPQLGSVRGLPEDEIRQNKRRETYLNTLLSSKVSERTNMLSRLIVTDSFFASHQEKQLEAEKGSVNDTEPKSINSKSGRFNTKIMVRNTERTTDRDSRENIESGMVQLNSVDLGNLKETTGTGVSAKTLRTIV